MNNNSGTISVKTSSGNISIKLKDILYIKGCRKHTLIFFTKSTIVKAHHMLTWFETYLNCNKFCRCHRSYIVNLNCVEYKSACSFLLKENISIPISRVKKDFVKKVFSEFAHNNFPDS
jgi:DNA-binding LytR/AlgR family response regulator